MGDHRASIKCQVEMHGVEKTCDMWINWSPGFDGVDYRVIEFFRDWAEKARQKYDEELYEHQREQREKEQKDRELLELARLKKKYGPTVQGPAPK